MLAVVEIYYTIGINNTWKYIQYECLIKSFYKDRRNYIFSIIHTEDLLGFYFSNSIITIFTRIIGFCYNIFIIICQSVTITCHGYISFLKLNLFLSL